MEQADSLPSSKDAEKGLISSLLHAPAKTLDLCKARGITKDWFLDEDLSTLYSTILEMTQEKLPIDLISLGQYVKDRKVHLNDPVPEALLTSLFTFIPTAANASYFATVAQEQYARRLVILEAREIGRKVKEECSTLQETFDAVSGAFSSAIELCVEPEPDEDYDKKAMQQFLDRMEDAATGKKKPEFFPTSFPMIDEECGGLTRGELLLIRGRKGCGKSLLGQAVIQNNALGPMARKASIYTFEMPFDQYMRRLVAAQGMVSLKSQRDGTYSKHEFSSFLRAWNDISASGIRIYDTDRMKKATPEAIFSSIRKRAKNEKLDIAMIDHLHLLALSGNSKSEKRSDEMYHEFSAGFKALCLELKIVGILLAQENNDGGTFGGSQVETDVDASLSLTAVFKTINNIKRVVGTDGAFCDKWREGNLLGRKIPLTMDGKYARIYQTKENVKEEAF